MMKERDDFWDISDLIPPKRHGARSPFASAAAPVSLEVTTPAEQDKATERPAPRAAEQRRLQNAAAQEVAYTYVPKENPLLLEVKVFRRPSGYNFYHRFREDALPWLEKTGAPCAFVPYFSYIPQFGQLTAEQGAFYLYFRDEANAGRYIQTAQSYILLYVYEIINLPDLIAPSVGARRLAGIWAAYRKVFPQINKYMIQWLMDYCLLHRLACPYAEVEGFIHEYLDMTSLREFYLGTDGELSECRLDAVLTLASDYQYKNGRYATGEHAAAILEHVPAAAKEVLRVLLCERKEQGGGEAVTLRFDAYCGALYAAAEKYTIEVRYYSVAADETMRAPVTAIVKYAENKVRAERAIKSRLSVGEIPARFAAMLDAYFEQHGPVVSVPAPRPEYEALYDADSVEISWADAEEIENNSWQNTKLLVSEDEAEPSDAPPISLTQAPTTPDTHAAAHGGADVPLAEADTPLSLADLAALALALETGRAPALDAVERINEVFVDRMGDIVFELNGETAELIEDYRTEVRELLDSCGYHG